MRPRARRACAAIAVAVVLAVGVSARGDGPGAAPARVVTRALEARWLDESGTALLGFGILRVAPTDASKPATLEIRYEERPTDYAAFDAVQVLVLPTDAFARDGRAFADRAIAWARSPSGSYVAKARVDVRAPALLLVAYGPFSGVDTSRPLGTSRSHTLDVADAGGLSRTWVDASAGELTVKAWTAHPEIARGGPWRDVVSGEERWFEVRPEIVYDTMRLSAPGDPEPPQSAAVRREADTLRQRARVLREKGTKDAALDLEREADDLDRTLGALDDRVPVPGALAERLRRLPFRWR